VVPGKLLVNQLVKELAPFAEHKFRYHIRSRQSQVLVLSCTLNGVPSKTFECYIIQQSVQNLLSSRLLLKNLKIRIYKTIILPVFLYGCETWFLILRE
jgi:hypothetical protein